MVRKKIPIRKIKDEASLHITYSKRKCGLIRKSYEISILTEAKVAFISFSEAHRLNFFSGVNRIEDVIEHYVTSPKFLEAYTTTQQEHALRTLSLIRGQNGTKSSYHSEATALRREEEKKQEELKKAMDSVKTFQVEEDEIKSSDSISKIKRHENFLIDTLQQFSRRKMYLLQSYNSSNGPSTSQNDLVHNHSWLEGKSQVQDHHLQSQERQLSELLNEQSNLVQSRPLEGPSQLQNCLPQTQEWQLPMPLNTQTDAYPIGPSTSIHMQENWSQQGQYNSEVQSLPFPSVYDLQDNILSQPPDHHLPLQNARNSSPPAPQASAACTFQDIAEEPANAGTSMLPSMESITEEFDYSYMFTDSYFSDDMKF